MKLPFSETVSTELPVTNLDSHVLTVQDEPCPFNCSIMNGFLTGSCRSSEISSMQWRNKCLLFKTCNPGRSFASDCGVSVASQKKDFKDVSRSWCFCRSSNDRVDLPHFFSDCSLQCWSRMRETLSIKQIFSTVTFISALFQIWMIYYSCSCYCAHCLCKVYFAFGVVLKYEWKAHSLLFCVAKLI